MAAAGAIGGGQGTAQLAAYTVATHPDGTIQVTIRELRDAAGLQRTLRADGVPANVTFLGPVNTSCRIERGPLAESTSTWTKIVVPEHPSAMSPVALRALTTVFGVNMVGGRVLWAIEVGTFRTTRPNGQEAVFDIRKAAIPHGFGLAFASYPGPVTDGGNTLFVMGVLVQASPQCTG
jgi:hypothetical protein